MPTGRGWPNDSALALWHLLFKINTRHRGFKLAFSIADCKEATARAIGADLGQRLLAILPQDSAIAYARVSRDDRQKESRFIPEGIGQGRYVATGVDPPPSVFDEARTCLLVRFESDDGSAVTRKFAPLPDDQVGGGQLVHAITPVINRAAALPPLPVDGDAWELTFSRLLTAIVLQTHHVNLDHEPGGEYRFFYWSNAYPLKLGVKAGGRPFENALAGAGSAPPGPPLPEVVTEGLRAWYMFDEGAGSVLGDSSGNARHGTLGAGLAAPTWAPGAAGGLTFPDGTYVTLPDEVCSTGRYIQAVFLRSAPGSHRAIIGRDGSGWMWAISPGNDFETFDVSGTGLKTQASPSSPSPYLASIVLANPFDAMYNSDEETTYSAANGSLILARTPTKIGNAGFGFPFLGTLYALLVYENALTLDQQATNRLALQRLLSARSGQKALLVFSGNSHVIGDVLVNPADRLDAKTLALLSSAPDLINRGLDGQQTQEMISAQQLDADYSILRPQVIEFVWEGQNDLALGSVSVVDAGNHLATYCARRQSQGRLVLVGTVGPRADLGTYSAANRASLNAFLRDQWPNFADGIVDFAADPIIGPEGANLDSTYYLDGLHMKAAGNARAAALLAAKIQALGVA